MGCQTPAQVYLSTQYRQIFLLEKHHAPLKFWVLNGHLLASQHLHPCFKQAKTCSYTSDCDLLLQMTAADLPADLDSSRKGCLQRCSILVFICNNLLCT